MKVLDFGIARFIDDAESVDELAEITEARQVCGTPQYMAPEQVSFGAVDARTDLYTLGVVFYRMLTGRLPFRSSSHHDLFRHHLKTTPPGFAQVAPDRPIPGELEALAMRALAKRPDDRFASASEMRLALRQIRLRLGLLGDEGSQPSGSWREPTPSTPPEPAVVEPPPERRRWPLALLLLLLGAGLATAVMFVLRPPPPRTAGPVTTPPPAVPVVVIATAVDAGPPPRVDAAAPIDASAPAPDAEGPAPKTGAATLTSSPSGAVVYWRGRVIGRTPLRTSFPIGVQKLRLVRGGRQPVEVRLDVAAGTLTREVFLPRERSEAPTRRPKPTPPPPTPPPAEASTPAPKAVAAPDPKPTKVKLQLLDEDGARSFDVGGPQPKRGPPTGPKPAIDLLDE